MNQKMRETQDEDDDKNTNSDFSEYILDPSALGNEHARHAGRRFLVGDDEDEDDAGSAQ